MEMFDNERKRRQPMLDKDKVKQESKLDAALLSGLNRRQLKELEEKKKHLPRKPQK